MMIQLKLAGYVLINAVLLMNMLMIIGRNVDAVLIKRLEMDMIGVRIYLMITHALTIGNANQVDV